MDSTGTSVRVDVSTHNLHPFLISWVPQFGVEDFPAHVCGLLLQRQDRTDPVQQPRQVAQQEMPRRWATSALPVNPVISLKSFFHLQDAG